MLSSVSNISAKVVLYCLWSIFVFANAAGNLWYHNVGNSIFWGVLGLFNLVMDYVYFHNRLIKHEYNINLNYGSKK
jgi:hypothetical protein